MTYEANERGEIVVTSDPTLARFSKEQLAALSPEQRGRLAETFRKAGFNEDTLVEKIGEPKEPAPQPVKAVEPVSPDAYRFIYPHGTLEGIKDTAAMDSTIKTAFASTGVPLTHASSLVQSILETNHRALSLNDDARASYFAEQGKQLIRASGSKEAAQETARLAQTVIDKLAVTEGFSAIAQWGVQIQLANVARTLAYREGKKS
jgi:hypothetical protein